MIKGHSKIRPLFEMTPLSNSQLRETYPTVTEPKRALAPPFQLTPITGPILQRPEGIRRKEIAEQTTATKATETKMVKADRLKHRGASVTRLPTEEILALRFHRKAELLRQFSGVLHFLTRAVASITLISSRVAVYSLW